MDEKFIAFQDDYGKPIYREAIPEEIAAMQAIPEKSDWLHDYPLRIVAPKTLAFAYPQFYVWFMLNDLPMEKVGDSVQIYCNGWRIKLSEATRRVNFYTLLGVCIF